MGLGFRVPNRGTIVLTITHVFNCQDSDAGDPYYMVYWGYIGIMEKNMESTIV